MRNPAHHPKGKYFLSGKQMREAKFNASVLQSRIKRGEEKNLPIIQSPCGCGCGLMTFVKLLESLHGFPEGWSWQKKFKGKVLDKTEKLLRPTT